MIRRLVALAGIGIAVVALARVVNPFAPPLYDGIIVPVEPYHYVSPPPPLASSNKAATGGSGTLSVLADGTSNFGTVVTQDKQVTVFFPKAVFTGLTGDSVAVSVDPLQKPPPPPPGATYIGNVYSISASPPGGATPGASGPPPSPVGMPIQMLLRVPPVVYNAVELYFGGSWHNTPWGAQPDYASVTINNLGYVAAINDPKLRKNNVQPSPGFSLGAILEIASVVVALVVIIVAAIRQRRRARS